MLLEKIIVGTEKLKKQKEVFIWCLEVNIAIFVKACWFSDQHKSAGGKPETPIHIKMTLILINMTFTAIDMC